MESKSKFTNENRITVNKREQSRKESKLKFVLYTEDFDFAQSISLYFQKEFHKVSTTNDEEILIQIVKSIQPDFVILDISISESLITLVEQLKKSGERIRIILFTSPTISKNETLSKLQNIVDQIFFQPIDIIEFNQLVNFYSAD